MNSLQFLGFRTEKWEDTGEVTISDFCVDLKLGLCSYRVKITTNKISNITSISTDALKSTYQYVPTSDDIKLAEKRVCANFR